MRVTEYVLASQDDPPPVQMVLWFEVLVPFTKDLAEMLWCYLQSITYFIVQPEDAPVQYR